MKFKFITADERRTMMVNAASGDTAIKFVHFGNRRFIEDDGVICLVTGEDEIIGQPGGPEALTVEESRRVIDLVLANTKGRVDALSLVERK